MITEESVESDTIREVVITDIRMRFWSMVWFMVKWSIASIPALVILFFIGLVISAGFGLLCISVFHYFYPGALSSLLLAPLRAIVPGAQ